MRRLAVMAVWVMAGGRLGGAGAESGDRAPADFTITAEVAAPAPVPFGLNFLVGPKGFNNLDRRPASGSMEPEFQREFGYVDEVGEEKGNAWFASAKLAKSPDYGDGYWDGGTVRVYRREGDKTWRRVHTGKIFRCQGMRGFVAVSAGPSFEDAGKRKTDYVVRAAERMEKLRDDGRVFSKSLGFNIPLLPEGQDAAKFYAENRSERFFTPEQVSALADRDWATLNHLLPVLRGTVRWDAFGGDVVVMGIEGEIFIKAPGIQAPMEEAIPPGELHVGEAIRQRLGLAPGRRVAIQGREFTVRRLLPQKGNIDDVSLLMNLADAQGLLGLEGKVGGVLALSCNCAAGELDPIRAEVGRAVAGVQVIEFSVQARVRRGGQGGRRV